MLTQPSETPLTLVTLMLREQQAPTAVERFSSWHEKHDRSAGKSAGGSASDSAAGTATAERSYRDLIPLTAPRPGQQYAFEVDLDSCSGCKACVTACHQLNGLDEAEAWRSVGILLGGNDESSVLQHVTTACHHCLEPACLHGCPVEAYEKNPDTGIVVHLDDQCIGCQYCIWKCPYDVPQYNKRLGIVRKCDMCHDRLAADEAPACVQGCPNRAIKIKLVEQEVIAEESATNLFLPGAPEPSYTLPTTRYTSKQPLPRNLLPADYHAAQQQHAHWPLIWMLVLTQASVGAFVIDRIVERLAVGSSAAWESSRAVHLWAALLLGLVGLVASTFHLGRPWLAYRAILGLKTSWLSREIVTFGLYAGAAVSYAAWAWLGNAAKIENIADGVTEILGWAVSASGVVGIFCSAMIYASTQRPLWNAPATLTKFLLTGVMLGLPLVQLLLLVGRLVSAAAAGAKLELSAVHDLPFLRQASLLLLLATTAKLLLEASVLRHLGDRVLSPLKRTALLLTGELAVVAVRRLFLGVVGGVILPGMMLLGQDKLTPLFIGMASCLSFLALLVGELTERYLFFTAVVAPKMPGAPAS